MHFDEESVNRIFFLKKMSHPVCKTANEKAYKKHNKDDKNERTLNVIRKRPKTYGCKALIGYGKNNDQNHNKDGKNFGHSVFSVKNTRS